MGAVVAARNQRAAVQAGTGSRARRHPARAHRARLRRRARVAGLRDDLAGEEGVRLVDAGVERRRPAVARDARVPRRRRDHQCRALQQRRRYGDVAFDAAHQRRGAQARQRRLVDLRGEVGHRLEAQAQAPARAVEHGGHSLALRLADHFALQHGRDTRQSALGQRGHVQPHDDARAARARHLGGHLVERTVGCGLCLGGQRVQRRGHQTRGREHRQGASSPGARVDGANEGWGGASRHGRSRRSERTPATGCTQASRPGIGNRRNNLRFRTPVPPAGPTDGRDVQGHPAPHVGIRLTSALEEP